MLPLWAIGAIVGGANEATTGKEQEKRDAILKATAYRNQAYLKSLEPENFKVRNADILAGATQGGMAGYSIENQSANDNAYRSYLASMTNKNTAATKGIDPEAPVNYAPTGVSPGSEDGPGVNSVSDRDLNNYNDGPRKQNRTLASTPYARAARLNGFVVV